MKLSIYFSLLVLLLSSSPCLADEPDNFMFVRHLEKIHFRNISEINCYLRVKSRESYRSVGIEDNFSYTDEDRPTTILTLDDGLEFLSPKGYLYCYQEEPHNNQKHSKTKHNKNVLNYSSDILLKGETNYGQKIISILPKMLPFEHDHLTIKIQPERGGDTIKFDGEVTASSKELLHSYVSSHKDVGFWSTDYFITLSDKSVWKVDNDRSMWKKGDKILVSTSAVDNTDVYVLINVDSQFECYRFPSKEVEDRIRYDSQVTWGEAVYAHFRNMNRCSKDFDMRHVYGTLVEKG